jgi:hypothetical protein
MFMDSGIEHKVLFPAVRERDQSAVGKDLFKCNAEKVDQDTDLSNGVNIGLIFSMTNFLILVPIIYPSSLTIPNCPTFPLLFNSPHFMAIPQLTACIFCNPLRLLIGIK